MALKRGEVRVNFKTSSGDIVNVVLNNALYIPTFPQDIFSVNRATEQGAQVTFGKTVAVMTASDGTQFVMPKRGKLWFIDVYDNDCNNSICIKSVDDNDLSLYSQNSDDVEYQVADAILTLPCSSGCSVHTMFSLLCYHIYCLSLWWMLS